MEIYRDEKGRLLPGHSGLKPQGATSRLPTEIKEKLTEFIAGKIITLDEIYEAASPKDRLKFLIELMSFVVPKMRHNEVVLPEDNSPRIRLQIDSKNINLK